MTTMVNPTQLRAGADLTEIRARLKAMADALRERQDALAASRNRVREEVLDDVDHAQRVSEERYAATVESTIIEAHAQLAHALAIVDAGGYGICEDCGARISEARLAFRPESTRCLTCQGAMDRRGGRDFVDWS
jgi:DnaK suppressor protein